MKQILLILSIVTLFITTQVYSQEKDDADSTLTELAENVFSYTLSHFQDLRAVIYLYRSRLDEQPKDYSAILRFVNEYNLKYKENPADTIQYTPNPDGSAQIAFSLNSVDGQKHRLSDSILIRRVVGLIGVGAPLTKSSSITSIYGEIATGQIEYESGMQVSLPQFKSGFAMTRVDIETVKRISNAKQLPNHFKKECAHCTIHS